MRQWLVCVGASTAIGLLTFWGLGALVHWRFYVQRRARAAEWKRQPERWLTPSLERQARVLGGINLVAGSIVGGSFAWYVQRGGWSALYLDARAKPLLWMPVSALLALVMIDAGLYYSHRALHHRAVFRYVHRWHHRYVAPTVFTTTAMHPLEFFIFTACLALPAFVVPMHPAVYVAVIGYTYFIGMVDHAGVRFPFRLPLHGEDRFHDDHHIYVECNYGHHTAFFDRLHGTAHVDDAQ